MTTEKPSSVSRSEITQLFIGVKSGDEQAKTKLTQFLYHELKHMASSKRRTFKNSHTLNTTALVNETWLKLKKSDLSYNDKNHFLSIAALAMRQILLDDSRRKSFLNQQQIATDFSEQDNQSAYKDEAEWLHQLDIILSKLEAHNPRLALVFNLKFFCGLTYPELADYFEVSEKTAQRDWEKAKVIIATTMDLINKGQ